MSSENRPGSFLFVPDVKSAEKVLHEHELDTITSFVMYYNNGLGKGKLKCMVSVFCNFTNYWFVYTKMEYPGAEYCTWHRRTLFFWGGEGETNKKNSWQYHNSFLNTKQSNRIIMMIITTMLIE